MTQPVLRDTIYKRRVFGAQVIELCVRWYISYRLSYRDLVLIIAERQFSGAANWERKPTLLKCKEITSCQ
jgi:hypothetical protein